MWRGHVARGTAVAKRHPLVFGTAVVAVKTGAMDLAVQILYEGRSIWLSSDDAGDKGWDRRRTLLFALFGASFLGAWQCCLFVKIMPRLCPAAEAFAAKPLRAKLRDGPGLRQLAAQLFVEHGINNPILYFPCFYSFKAYMADHPQPFRAGLQRYSESWRTDVPEMLMVWGPAQLINFAFSPMWLRVPFVAGVSLLWTTIMSVTRGKIGEGEFGDVDGEAS